MLNKHWILIISLKKIITCFLFLLLLANLLLNNNLHAKNIFVIKDLELQTFMESVLQPLYEAANINKKSINVYIINDSIPNAFVSNGQNIFIHTGLITFADNVDELAGVLAHELAHINAGHIVIGSMAQEKTSILMLAGIASMLLVPLVAATSGNSDLTQLIGFLSLSSSFFGVNSYLRYSTTQETQADQIAVSYINKTNYSLQGFLNFMNKLYTIEDKEKYNLPSYTWFSTHPLTLTRVNFLKSQVEKYHDNKINDSTLNQQFLLVKAKIIASESNINTINKLYNNKDKISLYAKAIAYYKAYDFENSLKYINLLITQYPQIPYFAEVKADIFYAQQNYTQAITEYNKVIELNKYSYNNYLIYYQIAQCYFALNNLEESLKNLNITLQYYYNNPAAWRLKSIILGKLNRNGEANLALAEQYMILEQFEKAKFFAQKALTTLKKDSPNWIKAQDIIDYSIIKK